MPWRRGPGAKVYSTHTYPPTLPRVDSMPRSFVWVVPLALATVFLLTVPGAFANGGAAASGPLLSGALAPPGTGAPINNTFLSLGAGTNVSSQLFGTTVTARASLIPNEGSLVNATPARLVVWPGGDTGDWYDPLGNLAHGLLYDPYNNRSRAPLTNESEFVAWCRSINCTAILQVPGEINNTTVAREIVAYTVNATYNATTPGLDFRPAYWEIGNEPELWDRWGEQWGHMLTAKNQNIGITPLQYAQEVKAYILAMDAANSSYVPKVLGLPGAGKGNGGIVPWLDDVVNATGANLSGVAIHVYPDSAYTFAGNNSSAPPPMGQFYAGLLGVDSLQAHISDAEQEATAACKASGCHLPLFVTEIGTALSHYAFGPYAATFPGALGAAVQGIQALQFNSSTLVTADVFGTVSNSNNSWFNLTGGTRPDYVIYADVLSHLGHEAFPVQVNNATKKKSPYVVAIATVDPGANDRHDLLVVNTNVNGSATFGTSFISSANGSLKGSVRAATFTPGAPVMVWEWNGTNISENASIQGGTTTHCCLHLTYDTSAPNGSAPTPHYFPGGLPSSFTLPPQSLALFETYNAPAYPVVFNESGLNVGWKSATPRWFLEVGGFDTQANTSSLTLLLPPGTYASSGVALTLPPGGTVPRERLNPYLAPTVLGNAPESVNVPYGLQWAINVTWNGSLGTVVADNVGAGTGPPPYWWNASLPLDLVARANPGAALLTWAGEGPAGNGNVSGYHNGTITIVPTSNISEQAIFVGNVATVIFSETGLPTGTPWTVTMRGIQVVTVNRTVTYYEIRRTLSYQIDSVPGYHLDENLTGFGSLNLTNGGTVTVPVIFERLYSITFTEQGLPSGTPWSVTINNGANQTETGTSPGAAPVILQDYNGNWSYTVSKVPGYRAVGITGFGSVHVADANKTVNLQFDRLYNLTFLQTGLPAGTPWSVVVEPGTSVSLYGNSTGATPIHLQEVNGIWAYRVGNVSGYRARGISGFGSFRVNGSAVTVQLVFNRTFTITFQESGLPAGTPWSVTIENGTPVSLYGTAVGSAPILLSEIDGKWSYVVGAVPDFRVARFSGFGAVRVSNSSVTVNLQFNRLYTISFEETGLPNGTAWWVTIEPGTNMSETGLSNGTATVDLQEINNIGPTAEWSYSVSNIPGYWLNHTNGWGGVHIAGANVSVALWFRGTYSVRFTETGLDLESGLSWTVSLQNVTGTEVASSTSDTIVLPDLVGGWAYQVTNVSGYRIEAATGSQFGFVYVNGTTAVSVDFAFLYTITFKETGLPRGTDWTWEVVLGDGTSVQESNSSSGTSLSLLAPDGVWGYVVPEVFVGGVGFRAVGAAHAVDIANANQTVVVSFGQLYPVLLTESGLTAGTEWSVAVGNGSALELGSSVAPGSILVNETNGSYGFSAWAVGNNSVNWVPVSPLYFSVSNGSVVVNIVYRPGYKVEWVENGLPAGLNWSVLVNGVRAPAGVGQTRYQNLTNATYSIAIPSVDGWVAFPHNLSVTVDGSALTFDVQFVAATFAVTFALTGIPGGNPVLIRISNLNTSTSLPSLTVQVPNSTFNDGKFNPNGAYTYDVVPPSGYYATPAGGNVTVNGHSVVVTVAILPIGRGPTPPFWTLVVPAATTAGALGLAGAGMFALLGAIRRRRGGAPL